MAKTKMSENGQMSEKNHLHQEKNLNCSFVIVIESMCNEIS